MEQKVHDLQRKCSLKVTLVKIVMFKLRTCGSRSKESANSVLVTPVHFYFTYLKASVDIFSNNYSIYHVFLNFLLIRCVILDWQQPTVKECGRCNITPTSSYSAQELKFHCKLVKRIKPVTE